MYDTTIDDEGVLIVMEYVDGESLRQALMHGRLETGRALEVIRAVAAALDHAHASGVVHRDVKPANVLLGAQGVVKLVDLGIATASESTRLTASGTVLGTPSYMAPEQLEGRGIGPEVDVYALAAVAFEVLSGRKARRGDSPLEIAHRTVSEPPPDLREVWPGASDDAAAALQRGMCRDPAGRQPSAGELARELAEAVEAHSTAAHAAERTLAMPAQRPKPPTPVAPAAPPMGPTPAPRAAAQAPETRGRRSSGWLAAAAVAALAVVAAVVLLASGGDEAPTGQPAGQTDGAQRETGSGRDAERSAVPEGSSTAPTETTPTTVPPAEDATGGSGVPEPSGENDPARGAQLNSEGKSLVDQGRPDEAIPVLEDSVAAYPAGTSDVTYAYALFNLGHALRVGGRPDEAIPVLERRLEIPDQQAVVKRELRLARQEARSAR